MEPVKCKICDELLSAGPIVEVVAGMKTLYECSEMHNDGLFTKSMISVVLHVNCRKKYTRRPVSTQGSQSRSLSSDRRKDVFDFKSICLFCDEKCVTDSRHPESSRNVHMVATIELQDKILSQSKLRGDEIGAKVAGRIETVFDLVAAECRYHGNCYRKFFKLEAGAAAGRPPISDVGFTTAFQKLCDYIDNNDEQCQYTIKELMGLLNVGHSESITIDERTLIRKLETKYGDKIKVEGILGKGTNLYFFISEQTMKSKSRPERRQIIKWAAEILNEEARSQNYECKYYPTLCMNRDRHSKFPELINLFMTELILNDKKATKRERLERKVFAVQEIITSLIRERSYVSPLLTHLGIHLHRIYDSKYLNDILHSLGLSCSYNEILKFETSATVAEKPAISSGAFTQMVFDNADINVRTLDGRNTFHAMGGILCSTPHDSISIQETLPRSFELPAGYTFSTTPIQWFTPPNNFNLRSKAISKIAIDEPKSLRTFQKVDMLYLSSMYMNLRIESWNGFMSQHYNKTVSGILTTNVLPVPFINLDPGNLSTIYTSLRL